MALDSTGRDLFACGGFAIAQALIDGMGNGWLFTAAGLCDVAEGAFGGGGGGTEEVWGWLEGGDEWEDCMMDGWGWRLGKSRWVGFCLRRL